MPTPVARPRASSVLRLTLPLLLVSMWPTQALAFCRTTTCERCAKDEAGCAIEGAPLYWPTSSFGFGVEPTGSPRLGITGPVTLQLFEDALDAWTSVDCGGWQPSIGVASVTFLDQDASTLGLSPSTPNIERDDAEPNHLDRLNSLRFVDQEWIALEPGTVALTTVSYLTRSGKIVAADVEMNSANNRFTTSGDGDGYDLLSVLTHESGHVFGLADLPNSGPTMYGFYSGGHIGPRSLETDDVAGICAIYPMDRFAEDEGCGCRLAHGNAPKSAGGFLLIPALATLRRQRRAGWVSRLVRAAKGSCQKPRSDG